MSGEERLPGGNTGGAVRVGDPAYLMMVEQGVDAALETAVAELADFPRE